MVNRKTKPSSRQMEDNHVDDDWEPEISESEHEDDVNPSEPSNADGKFDSENSDPMVSDSDDEVVRLNVPSKKATYNADAMLDKLNDIAWPSDVDWLHRLSIDVDDAQAVDVNDDLARELAFYTQGLEGTRQAFGKLESLGLPFLRPSDYYAEMVKTDSHMEKIKCKLLYEKKQIEEAEERRKSRESKRISKQVQAEKLKERAKQKKDQVESVKKWRKERQKSGFTKLDKDDMPNFEDGKGFERPGRKNLPGVSPGDRSGGKGKRFAGKKGWDKKRKGREFKNDKFGNGGRKGMKKQNTADTTNDVRGFNKAGDGNKKRRVK